MVASTRDRPATFRDPFGVGRPGVSSGFLQIISLSEMLGRELGHSRARSSRRSLLAVIVSPRSACALASSRTALSSALTANVSFVLGEDRDLRSVRQFTFILDMISDDSSGRDSHPWIVTLRFA